MPASCGTHLWPGSAEFADDQAESTSVFFTHEGTHEIRVTATEGAVQLAREFTVDVGAYVPPVLPTPEIGWWRFDEGSGSIAIDSTTPANNGTLGGFFGNPWESGKTGGALSFSDRSDFVTIPDSDELDGMSQVTFACWVKPSTFDDEWRALIGKNVSHAVDESYAIYVGPSNRLWVVLDGSLLASSGSVPANQWTHVAVAFDGSKPQAERLRIYLSGVFDAENATGLNQIPATTSPLYLGSLQGTNVNGHNGLLDDVRIYDRILSDAEIASFTALPPNYGPEIQLSAKRTGQLGAPHPVSATLQDDGQSNGESLLHRWGGSNVNFDSRESLSTHATFDVGGDQEIHLSASDGFVTTLKTMNLNIIELLTAYDDWAGELDWQGRDSAADSSDNVHRIPNLILYAMDLHPLVKEPGATRRD